MKAFAKKEIRDNMTFRKFSPRSSPLNYHLVPMVITIAAVGVFSILWGERISIYGGFGWDGRVYGTIAQNMDVRSLDFFYIQRIFSSLIVHSSLTVLQQPLDNEHVVVAFSVLNLVALLSSCFLYRCIASELNLSTSGFWLGFIGIFVNFLCLKSLWYVPVMTDFAAIALSLAMLLFYLRKQQLPLALVTLLGAFTWPTLIYIGVLLLTFPRTPIVEQDTRHPRYLAAGLAAFVFASVLALYYVWGRELKYSAAAPIRVLVPFSLALCLMYVYAASVLLLHGISGRTIFTSLTPRRAAIAGTLFAAARIPAYYFASSSRHYVNALSTTADIVERSVVRPLGFLAAHAIYFGPVFLLFLFYWKPFSKLIRSYGLGLTLVILMGVFLSINTESRQNIPSYVMAVPFLGLLVKTPALPARFFWLIGALALASSKVWMRMRLPAYDDGKWLRFPLQRLFMSVGPWIDNRMFVLQGAIVLATAILLYVYLRHRRHEVNC